MYESWILKTIIGWGFCDIQNNQGRGRGTGYQPKPKAEADNPYRKVDMITLGNHALRSYLDMITRDLDMIIV